MRRAHPRMDQTLGNDHLLQAKVWRAYGTTAAVSVLILVTLYFVIAAESPVAIFRSGTSPREQTVTTDCQSMPCPGDQIFTPVVQRFLAEMREATKLAAGGEDESVWFNEDAMAKWKRENPCVSRTEMASKYSRRRYVRDVDPSPQWQAVLEEYTKLHRTCMHRIGDATTYFMARNTSIPCKFTVVDTANVGLGNRMLVIASAVAYAVLTKRVILLAGGAEFIPPQLLCEPFTGSSWVGFDVARNATPFHKENEFWNISSSFHCRIDDLRRQGIHVPGDYAVANMDVNSWVGQPESQFFCDVEQEYYEHVPWVYLTGMLYFLPKLFTVPAFRPLLLALFPDRMALTRILRTVMMPADPVWTRVDNIDRAYLMHSDRRLGVQLRYRGGTTEYDAMHHTIATRVLQCAINNTILPSTEAPHLQNVSFLQNLTKMSLPKTSSVFVASLFEGVKNNLTETFLRHPTMTNDVVRVIQLSHQGEQKFGIDVFQEALAEILILSFSDYLFVTPRSTFSGMAQAYGGLVPWFIDWHSSDINNTRPCTRAQTVDVCFQVPFDYNIKCPHDPATHNKPISDIFPDVQPCLAVDTEGLQLITASDLSMELHK